MLHSTCQQIWKIQQWPQDWKKVSFHSNPKERQCQRMLNLQHSCTISHTSKVMLKILQARLQQYVNQELPDVQVGFSKGRRTRDQITNIHWIIEKAKEFQKSFCFFDHTKLFDYVKAKVAQLCPTLWDPVNCTVHGILQTSILEWVAFPFSRGSSQPRDRTQVSCIAGGFFTSWATREAQEYRSG